MTQVVHVERIKQVNIQPMLIQKLSFREYDSKDIVINWARDRQNYTSIISKWSFSIYIFHPESFFFSYFYFSLSLDSILEIKKSQYKIII